ncbi:MAG: NTP transferase domain-containing protein [Planctomycetota bacterium]|nr:NTP transferase domain-containing protein [Planctomycetota bacterium]
MSVRVAILAAGASTRLGEPKALARIGDRTALEHLVEAASCVDRRPLVVVGAHAREIRAAAPAQCELLENPRWETGRTSGLALAREHAADCDLLVAPVDSPLVSAATFASLAAAWHAAGEPASGWLAPRERLSGRHGHPVLIGRSLLRHLEELSSLRELRQRARPLLDVLVEDVAVLDDLDTPADLERLRLRR